MKGARRRVTSIRCQLRRQFIGTSAALGWLACPVAGAQSVNDHWRMIDRTVTEIGGAARLSSANASQASRLASQLIDRGQFYLDLYEYERVITRDHAMQRDSIGKAGGVVVPAAAYFLGRSLQELGATREALAAYRRLASSPAPDSIRSAASAWTATITSAGGKSWQQGITDWRVGKVVASPACPPGQSACALLAALLGGDLAAIVQGQGVLARSKADYTYTASVKGRPFDIQFYDPVNLYLLAEADFALASRILERSPDEKLGRGIALLRAGQLAQAETWLRAVVAGGGPAAPIAAAYLGETLYRSGNKTGAEQSWGSAVGPAERIMLDSRSALGFDDSAALRRFKADSVQGLQRMSGRADAVFLARALLRHNRPTEALLVLEAFSRASERTDLNRVKPGVLVLFSRARYMTGKSGLRTNFALARDDMSSLAGIVPVVTPLLYLLQELTAPSRDGPGGVR
jgi:tetratricopeptide (TPR) repeat protein